MKQPRFTIVCALVAALSASLAGCSGIHIGVGLPIGGFGGVGVSVGSDGRIGGSVSAGRGGVAVGVGGTAQLPPRSANTAASAASAAQR